MLETDSTYWTTALPLHQTRPAWMHIYTQAARKQLSAFAGHKRDTFNIQFQTRQSRTKLNIPYLKHHICGFNPKLWKIIGKITGLTSLPAAGRNKPFLPVFLHLLEYLKGSKNIRKKIYRNKIHRMDFVVWIQSKSTVLCVLFWHNFITCCSSRKKMRWLYQEKNNLLLHLCLQWCTLTCPIHQQTYGPGRVLGAWKYSQKFTQYYFTEKTHLQVYVAMCSASSFSSGEMKGKVRPKKQPLAGQPWKSVHFWWLSTEKRGHIAYHQSRTCPSECWLIIKIGVIWVKHCFSLAVPGLLWDHHVLSPAPTACVLPSVGWGWTLLPKDIAEWETI